MKFENVKVRISAQVIRIGQPERWNVIETNVLLEDGDTFEDALDAGMKKVNDGHEKYSKSEYPDVVPSEVPKKKMTIDVLKVYEAAMKSSDQKVINQIQSEYHVIA